ncbi:MAG: HD domain-containing protein [Gemmatimonadetes bacterium]|nr:HD domain-containing protein [Gemmatimonadota bacterium]MBK6456309.1 HD domain-containing protein [Gemmatimonadota bacterium]MBK7834058.1 HD domain-containing protein [Gemmatimonadota bacterium]HNV73256.1 HD domain-containing protein [Gemmatimonadaceae bacterium]HPV74995.1 HD domain-containing protein [Gemmatimonadaceae bacterium]
MSTDSHLIPGALGVDPPACAEAREMLVRAEQEERAGHRAVARSLYEHALHGREVGLEPALVADALCGIARTWQLDGDSDAALDCLEVAQQVASATGLDSALGRALNIRAVILWQRGDLDAADHLYIDAHQCGVRAGDVRLTAMTSQNRGSIASVRGDITQALAHYRECISAYERLGLARELSGALNNLGMLHTDLGEWRAAASAYEKASRLAEREGDRSAQIVLMGNLAELALAQGHVDEAEAVCRRALPMVREMGDARAEAELRKHLGVIARERGEHTAAEQEFSLGSALASMRQDVLLQAELSREHAELLSRLGRYRETVQALNRSHQLFVQLRARRDLADLDRRQNRLEVGFLAVVREWGESIESKDAYTQGHCMRVADLACALARRAGFEERRMFWFRVGALLHDVGKIDIPAEILNKPGRLTAEEWALMRSHPEAGVELLKGIDVPEDVLPIILSHHEKWDGTGYPHGLSGEAIPMVARILGLADVYDALTTARSYKPGLPHAKAMEIIHADAGTHFDPGLVPLFERVLEERRDLGGL